jgi:multidrug efflux pump subunit AcrA (membrane-fusion protein)
LKIDNCKFSISRLRDGSLEILVPTPHLDTSTFAPDEPTLDARAVADARREVQTLADEVARLAKTDIARGEFYEQLLARTVTALAAVGGAIWTLGDKGKLEIADWKLEICNFQSPISNFPFAPDSPHTALLRAALDDPAGRLVAPHSSGEVGVGNPSDFLLLLVPIADDEGPRGVLEIFQRPDTRPAARQGFLQFARQMCELAGDYERARRLKQLVERQALWEQRDRFAREIHKSLDSTAAAYTLANEGRRLIGCDRASVALGRDRDLRVAAVSGQDAFDARSNVVARLAQLAEAVAATGEPLWYDGDDENLAPQVERALQAYLDVAHAKAVAVLPLMGGGEGERGREGENTSSSYRPLSPSPSLPLPIGALVVDQIHDCRFSEETKRRIEAVAEHGGAALANAVEHESLFLMPLWRTLGRMKWVVTARGLPRTLTALLALVCVAAALALVPAAFEIEAKGVLRPVERRDVFAAIDGVVTSVPVEHGQMVEPGQPLALLRNTDLEVQITDLTGRREATAKQMQAVQRALLAESRLGVEEKNRLSGQLLQLRKTYESLGLQLDLYRRKQEQLQVVSPIAGQVVTWQVRERLLRRPVRQGQVLMNVADPNGPWELELHMPEDRMGHVAQAARTSDAPLEVTYILATHPGESHVGRVEKIEAAAQVRGAEGNVVLIDVAIDKSELADLRPGATVTAKVHCGRRSIGYVWLHDLFAFVQRKILFRL